MHLKNRVSIVHIALTLYNVAVGIRCYFLIPAFWLTAGGDNFDTKDNSR